jgi:hypothetical protein
MARSYGGMEFVGAAHGREGVSCDVRGHGPLLRWGFVGAARGREGVGV